jgi:hypothetical protein
VQSASEPEMTAQIRAGVVERAENGIGFGRHKANIAITFRSGGDKNGDGSARRCPTVIPFCMGGVPFW